MFFSDSAVLLSLRRFYHSVLFVCPPNTDCEYLQYVVKSHTWSYTSHPFALLLLGNFDDTRFTEYFDGVFSFSLPEAVIVGIVRRLVF